MLSITFLQFDQSICELLKFVIKRCHKRLEWINKFVFLFYLLMWMPILLVFCANLWMIFIGKPMTIFDWVFFGIFIYLFWRGDMFFIEFFVCLQDQITFFVVWKTENRWTCGLSIENVTKQQDVPLNHLSGPFKNPFSPVFSHNLQINQHQYPSNLLTSKSY